MKWNRFIPAITLACAWLAPCGGNEAVAKERKYPERSVLDIAMVDIAPGLEDVVGLASHRGAYVIDPGWYPPQRSDEPPVDTLNEEDMIIGLDDQPIRSTRELERVISTRKPGDQVKLLVDRQGTRKVIEVPVKSSPPLIYLPAEIGPGPSRATGGGVGFWFAALAPWSFSYISVDVILTSPVAACTPLQLVRQTEKRTVVTITAGRLEIKGNWQAHSHLTREACLEEKAKIESIRQQELSSEDNPHDGG